MYEGIRRERQLRIQSLSRPEATNTLTSQSSTIALFAIFLFALAGLISGFSVGAFVRPNLALPPLNSNQSVPRSIPGQSQTIRNTPPPPRFGKFECTVIPN